MTNDKYAPMQAHSMPGHLIRRLHQVSTQYFAARMRDSRLEVTPVQFAALDAIRCRPGIDQVSVAALIAYDKVTIGGVIDRLVAKGLVSRRVSAHDRRAREVRMTARGEKLYRSLLPRVEQVQEDTLARLDTHERQQLMALLRKAIPEDLGA